MARTAHPPIARGFARYEASEPSPAPATSSVRVASDLSPRTTGGAGTGDQQSSQRASNHYVPTT